MKTKTLKYNDGIEEALRVREIVFVEEQHVPMEEEIDDIDKIATHIIVYDKGVPIGTGRLFQKQGKWFIGRVAVLKESRSKGIGQLIMRELTCFALKQGAKRIYVHAQTQVLDFYNKLGYIEYGPLFMDAGIPHKEMYRDV
ncbi:MAG: GNAT family N-acetyltransferase [Candidatus Cloacimonadota bacterium]|nr:MAG: GNAT family N-acetyltransferase [Candidatus Cloacimonadota bacterium]